MRKRVRVSIPNFVLEILKQDIKYFNLSKDGISNIVVQRLGFENNQGLHKKVLDKTTIWNFNLNDKNTELFDEMIKLSKETVESEFFRKVFSTYANLHPFLREKVLNTELFNTVENAIKSNHKLKIYYEKTLYDVYPIAFERGNDLYTVLKAKKEGKEFLFEMRYIEVLKIS
ncbi:hypothetical protein HF862_03270 [Fusobacterium sp. FSA-380-WT-3A]|nr:hypothetical protein [Fusobacterium sp. FSA-380-WT-3A]